MITTEKKALSWEGRLKKELTINGEIIEISLEGNATVDQVTKKLQSLNLQAKVGNQFVGQYIINSAGARSGNLNPSVAAIAGEIENLYVTGQVEIENEFAE